MKGIRFTAVALFSALLAVAPGYAQGGQEHDRGNRDQGRPEQHQREQTPQQQRQDASQQHQPSQHVQQPQHMQQPAQRMQQSPQRAERPQQFHEPQAQQPQRVQREQQPQRVQREQQPQRVQPPQRTERFEHRRDQYGDQRREARGPREFGPRQQLRPVGEQRHQQQMLQRDHWASYRSHHWEVEHRSWRDRGGYTGYRVPDYYFHEHYGRAHFFRVYSLPFMVVAGAPRFQYAGYWFTPVEPCPEYWATNWYESDDVYIDYVDGGYYMFNRRFPSRPGIAITITF